MVLILLLLLIVPDPAVAQRRKLSVGRRWRPFIGKRDDLGRRSVELDHQRERFCVDEKQIVSGGGPQVSKRERGRAAVRFGESATDVTRDRIGRQ
jgi:hypothetical protein